MKKQFSILLLPAMIFVFILSPSFVSARLVPCDGIGSCDYQALGQLANNIVNFIVFNLAMPVATLAILVSGIMLVIYSSNSSKRSDALNIMKIAVVGLVLVMSGYLIIQAIIFGLAGQEAVSNSLRSIFQR